MMKKMWRTKQGLEGELRVHWTSYDQLTLQLYIMLYGPMNVYTLEGQTSMYESMCSLAFVEGYITIMDMQLAP